MLIDFLHRWVRRAYLRYGFRSETLQLEDSVLHYYRYLNPAARQTIVLIHGLGTSSSTWVNIAPTLARSFNIIAFDLPGFGFSLLKGPSRFFSLKEQVRCLTSAFEELHLGPCTMIGHSLGGWIAARFALVNSLRISRLILVNPAGVFYESIESTASMFDLRSVADLHRLTDAMWFQYPWYFRPFGRAILADLKRRHVSEIVSSIRKEDFLNEELRLLNIPVSLVWGTEDRLMSGETVRIMKQSLPQLEIEFVDRCGHIPQLERPSELIETLLGILGKEDR